MTKSTGHINLIFNKATFQTIRNERYFAPTNLVQKYKANAEKYVIINNSTKQSSALYYNIIFGANKTLDSIAQTTVVNTAILQIHNDNIHNKPTNTTRQCTSLLHLYKITNSLFTLLDWLAGTNKQANQVKSD